MSQINTRILRVPGASGQISEQPMSAFMAPTEAAAEAISGLGEVAKEIAYKEQRFLDVKLASSLETKARLKSQEISNAIASAKTEGEVLALQQELDKSWESIKEESKDIRGDAIRNQFTESMNLMGGMSALKIDSEAKKHADAEYLLEEGMQLDQLVLEAIMSPNPELQIKQIREKVESGTGSVRSPAQSALLLRTQLGRIEASQAIQKYTRSIGSGEELDLSEFKNLDSNIANSLINKNLSDLLREDNADESYLVGRAIEFGTQAASGTVDGRKFDSPAEAFAHVNELLREGISPERRDAVLYRTLLSFENASAESRVSKLWGVEDASGLESLVKEYNERLSDKSVSEGPLRDIYISARDRAQRYANALRTQYTDDQKEYTDGVILQLESLETIANSTVGGENQLSPEQFREMLQSKMNEVVGASRNAEDRFPGGQRGFINMHREANKMVMDYMRVHEWMNPEGRNTSIQEKGTAQEVNDYVEKLGIGIGVEGLVDIAMGGGSKRDIEGYKSIMRLSMTRGAKLPFVFDELVRSATDGEPEDQKKKLESIYQFAKQGLIEFDLSNFDDETAGSAEKKFVAEYMAHRHTMSMSSDAAYDVLTLSSSQKMTIEQMNAHYANMSNHTKDLVFANQMQYLREERGFEGEDEEVFLQFRDSIVDEITGEDPEIAEYVKSLLETGQWRAFRQSMVMTGIEDTSVPGIQSLASANRPKEWKAYAADSISKAFNQVLSGAGKTITSLDEKGNPTFQFQTVEGIWGEIDKDGKPAGMGAVLLSTHRAFDSVFGLEEVVKSGIGEKSIPILDYRSMPDFMGIRRLTDKIGLWQYSEQYLMGGDGAGLWGTATSGFIKNGMLPDDFAPEEDLTYEARYERATNAWDHYISGNTTIMRPLIDRPRFEDPSPQPVPMTDEDDFIYGGKPSSIKLIKGLRFKLEGQIGAEKELNLRILSQVMKDRGQSGFFFKEGLPRVYVAFETGDPENPLVKGQVVTDKYGDKKAEAGGANDLWVEVTPDIASILQNGQQMKMIERDQKLDMRGVIPRWARKRLETLSSNVSWAEGLYKKHLGNQAEARREMGVSPDPMQ